MVAMMRIIIRKMYTSIHLYKSCTIVYVTEYEKLNIWIFGSMYLKRGPIDSSSV